MNIIMSRALPHHYPHRLPPNPQPAVLSSKPSTPTSPLDFTDRIPIEELTLSSETLGSGSFGTVFKGLWRKKHVVAVKQFKTREEIDSFLVEVKQLSCVKHTNIVKLYGASTSADTAYLVMEYAPGGSLNHLLHECKHTQVYDLRHACSWAMQTARGVAYLHGLRPKPIMHRDLKPANLLLFSNGKILKICDFGTACAVKTQMTNNTGSASYMAPEVFATSSYLESGDVFSWSIIFWEILVRTQPYSKQYSNPYQILWRVNQGTRPNEIEDCPQPIWDLITRGWNKHPKKRPSMLTVAEEMEFIFSLTKRPASSNDLTPTSGRSSSTGSSCSKFNMVINNTKTSASIIDEESFVPNAGHDSGTPHSLVQLMKRPWLPFFSPQLPTPNHLTTGQSSIAAAEVRHTAEDEPNHHHYQNYQQQQYQQSIHSQMQASNRLKALLRHLEVLQRRATQLESELQCDKKKNSAAESFKEFEELKNSIKRLKQQVREPESFRLSSGSTPTSPQHQP